ncbi:MAG: amino acid ABC transporter permease [Candidatus Bipolaricaulota bacterium]|nr:amino acid ABC transporter permease [Candidatus Bipolaricaulota bacterium]
MNPIIEFYPHLLAGLAVTLELIVCAAPLGLVIGIVIAVSRAYGGPIFSPLAYIYQIIFRGTPLLLQLFIIYYGLPRLGIVLNPLTAAIIGFGLCSGAYHSEYFRGALLSIPIGQLEAARTLGMGKLQTIRSIILPQMIRRAIPGCSNEITYLIKYSSLAYLVTVIDLTGQGRLIAYATFRFFDVVLIVGLIYLGLVTIANHLLQRLERKVRIPG